MVASEKPLGPVCVRTDAAQQVTCVIVVAKDSDSCQVKKSPCCLHLLGCTRLASTCTPQCAADPATLPRGTGYADAACAVCAAVLQVWSGSMDGKVYLYDADSQGALENPRTLAHESLRSGVRCLAHSDRSGKSEGMVVAGAEDGRVAIWSAASQTCLASAPVHSNIVSALCAIGDLVLLCCAVPCCACHLSFIC